MWQIATFSYAKHFPTSKRHKMLENEAFDLIFLLVWQELKILANGISFLIRKPSKPGKISFSTSQYTVIWSYWRDYKYFISSTLKIEDIKNLRYLVMSQNEQIADHDIVCHWLIECQATYSHTITTVCWVSRLLVLLCRRESTSPQERTSKKSVDFFLIWHLYWISK